MAPETAPQIASDETRPADHVERYTYTWEMPRRGFFRRAERVSAYQTEITLGQEVEILKLLRQYDLATLDDLKKKLVVENFLNRLIEGGEIYHLFRLLLQPKLSLDQLKAMPFTVQARVLSDFFGLNPGLMLLLRSFVAGNASFRENQEAADNASPPKE